MITRTRRSNGTAFIQDDRKHVRKPLAGNRRSRPYNKSLNRSNVKVSENPQPATNVCKRVNEVVHPYPEVVGLDREMLLVEYCDVIHQEMLRSEQLYTIKPFFLTGTRISSKMRAVLIDWLVQVHQRFRLLPETLFLTVYILDQTLTLGEIDKSRLQLAGLTAMMIASKYEEMICPEMEDFIEIADNSFTRKDIIKMEITVFSAISFMMNRPPCTFFCRAMNSKLQFSSKVYSMIKYICEVSLLSESLVLCLPSQLAASACYLACHLLGCDQNPSSICSFVNVPVTKMESVVKEMSGFVLLINTHAKLTSLNVKYASRSNHEVSRFTAQQIDLLKTMCL